MYRRVLPYLTLIVVLACNVDSTTQPPPPLPTSAGPTILDGAHPVTGLEANPDFFFISPTVPNPKNLATYGDNEFNASLLPLVTICELNLPNVNDDGAVLPETPCKAGPPVASLQLTASNVDPVAEKYQVDWVVPKADPVYYRIQVFASIGSTRLGFADLKTGPTPQALKGTSQTNFITRVDGSDLPIKFRIEEFALCEDPGTGPCSSETVNLTTGGTVSTTFPGDDAPTGVDIQPASGAGTTTITIEECDDLNPRAIDLPVYGKCARVTANPPLSAPLAQAAVVFICNAVDDIGTSLGATQRSRVTLHRYDESEGTGDPDSLTALPHVDPEACGPPPAPPPSFGVVPALKGFLADLRHGRFKSAGGRLVGMVSPKPLHATLLLDEGGGGLSFIFSDFQFALPARLRILSGDGQTAPPGSTLPNNPTVIVEDLGSPGATPTPLPPLPVAGATVTFSTTDGSASPVTVTTGSNGQAATAWTLKGTAGANSLKASGRGLAGSDFNGPRSSVNDPFQPIQTPFDAADPAGGPVEEPVRVGSVTFSATGATFGDIIVINDINVFDNTGMGEPENSDFVTGLFAFHTGTRTSGTVVWFDVGRSTALCTGHPNLNDCPAGTGPAGSLDFTTLRSTIGAIGGGLTITDVTSSPSNTVLTSIPASVRAIFLWMPIDEFTVAEINALKTFVGEGGLLVYVGENDGAYGPGGASFTPPIPNGDPTQNNFLTDMGSAMTRIGGTSNSGYVTLAESDLTLAPGNPAKHPIMANVTSLRIAAASESGLGPDDASLFRYTSTTMVLGAVARVSLTPLVPPSFARLNSRAAISQRVSSSPMSSSSTATLINAATGVPPR